MPVSVTLQIVRPRRLAVVRCEVFSGGVGAAWRMPLFQKCIAAPITSACVMTSYLNSLSALPEL
jgi:hypothetical protein